MLENNWIDIRKEHLSPPELGGCTSRVAPSIDDNSSLASATMQLYHDCYLNKGIEKKNLRASFFCGCTVESTGIFDTKNGGCFGVQSVTHFVGPIQI